MKKKPKKRRGRRRKINKEQRPALDDYKFLKLVESNFLSYFIKKNNYQRKQCQAFELKNKLKKQKKIRKLSTNSESKIIEIKSVVSVEPILLKK